MRLLLAGWRGQVARALAELAPSCPDVSALSIGRAALDVQDPGSVSRAMADLRPDVVINSAAYTGVDKAESEPEAAFRLNRDGARLLASSAARYGAAIIHISTDYVFDGSKGEPWREDDPPNPINVYGQSRLAGEEAVRQANPRHLIVRTSWLHGPHGRNFAKTVVQLASDGRHELGVVNDQVGSPTYAPHLAALVLELARKAVADPNHTPWGVYHAAGRGSASWFDLAEVLMQEASRQQMPCVPVVPMPAAAFPTIARRMTNARLDCTKLKRVFGLTLPDWRDGAVQCVARLKERGWPRTTSEG
jgi:dTDP-4-dehydrorhamnose reductase